MRVSLTTLGCKANQFDTEAIAASFQARGYQSVPFPAPADVYVINTCSVTQEATRKSRQLARRAHRLAPGAIVVLTGCYAQTGGAEPLDVPGVALVVGPQDRERIVDLVEEFAGTGQPRQVVRPLGEQTTFIDLPVPAFGEHTRAWLKIQDGCQQYCAYCQIPLARGPSRSLPLPRVLEEARRLTAAGYRELVLTGIHLGVYGLDLAARPTLAQVVTACDQLPGLTRLRLGSIEPNDLTPALIEALAESSTFCPHLHLPIQSGCDATLARMCRPYCTDDYALLLKSLRQKLPGIAVSTDLMVGFPGETKHDFLRSLRFVEQAGFSRLHVFPFSARPGTAAASFPDQIDRAVRAERSRIAVALGEKMARQFNYSLLGCRLPVLVEASQAGIGQGLAGQYVTVTFPAAADLRNRVVEILALSADAAKISGIITEEPV